MTILKPSEPQSKAPQSTVLPITRKVAIYYRQSTEAQASNFSVMIQTVEMVDHLKKLGWQQEHIMLIDLDRGISGTKGIRERPGMSILFDLIEHGEIGAVAAQDVDRFFRESAQIETNIFIDACRRNNVLVITPHVVYDFAHPIMGHFHLQMFREQAQRAVDYFTFFIKGRLTNARNYRDERGMYVGRRLIPGYMVDARRKLPDGSPNPNYRKYVPFQPWVDVMITYFELFRTNNGNFKKTYRMIKADGPHLPEVTPTMIPPGFHWSQYLRFALPEQRIPSRTGFRHMLTNVAFIGHWVHKDVITCWNNHEAIIPLDLFMYAFNRLSPTDFQGEPNPDYRSYMDRLRSRKSEHLEEIPTYHRLVFSNDLVEHEHKAVYSAWCKSSKSFRYTLRTPNPKSKRCWSISAYTVDRVVNILLLERLREIDADVGNFAHSIISLDTQATAKANHLTVAIREANQTKARLLTELAALTDIGTIGHIQDCYNEVDNNLTRLTSEQEMLKRGTISDVALVEFRTCLKRNIPNWETSTSQQKRKLFENIASYILISKIASKLFCITICWRDGTSSTTDIPLGKEQYYGNAKEMQKLCEMIEANVDQVEILRAFPKLRWSAIRNRYTRCIGAARWPKTYLGKRQYPARMKWEDTEEAKAEVIFRATANSSGPNTKAC